METTFNYIHNCCCFWLTLLSVGYRLCPPQFSLCRFWRLRRGWKAQFHGVGNMAELTPGLVRHSAGPWRWLGMYLWLFCQRVCMFFSQVSSRALSEFYSVLCDTLWHYEFFSARRHVHKDATRLENIGSPVAALSMAPFPQPDPCEVWEVVWTRWIVACPTTPTTARFGSAPWPRDPRGFLSQRVAPKDWPRMKKHI